MAALEQSEGQLRVTKRPVAG